MRERCRRGVGVRGKMIAFCEFVADRQAEKERMTRRQETGDRGRMDRCRGRRGERGVAVLGQGWRVVGQAG